ncbi:serine/threonine protein kinase [Cystobacter ferrugineus]|nr:serine/threonine-protein kinase [Cystobacter ferrugineus]
MYVARRDPDTDEAIGDYKVVTRLGAGGRGVVYKVERGGRLFALKLLPGPMDGRTKREIGILVLLENPGVVRYVGSDFWPHPARGYPYIVMEYVPGDTLEAFALKCNPSLRKCVHIVLDVAQTLGEVHGAGVFHRDLKPSNILIREKSERPVLIDFGIASLGGVACLTEARIPPATPEFRAPEPLRFLRENADTTAHYEYTPTDELWALGVTFYWLLTDVYPFGERTDEGEAQGLAERILTRRPVAPHLLNSRVPLAVSRVCMKMLAEWPAERYATVPELCSALQGALTQAENDATWEVPLVDPHDPQVTTTLEDPGLQEPNEVLRAFRKSGKQQPRRGLVRPKKALDLLLARSPEESPRAPIPEAEQDRIPTVGAPREAGTPAAEHEPPGEAGKPAPSASVPPAHEQLAPPVAARFSRAPWRLGLVAALATVSVVGLSVSAGLWGLGLSSHTGKGGPELTRPSMSPPHGSAGGVVDGHEVAPASKPLESFPGEGAAPAGALPPAPTVNAMPRTPTETKKNETQTQRAGLRLPMKPATVAAAAVAGCTLAAGCTGSTTQVRPEPPAISCPQDWRKTHEQFDVEFGGNTATVKGYKGEPGEVVRVKDGPVTLQVGEVGGVGYGRVGKLPVGTLLLGQWQLGDDRLFGTFTEAKIPGVGTVPVCLVAGLKGVTGYTDEHDKHFDCPPGLGVCLYPGSTPGNAKTHTRVKLIRPTGQP